MTPAQIAPFAWAGAFGVALVLHAESQTPSRRALGLLAGAAAAHVGWLLLHLDRFEDPAAAVVAAWSGFSLLFVPVGVLGVTRNASLFRALPTALATAKTGCLLAGCCPGVPLGPAADPLVPIAAWEILGLLALGEIVARSPERHVVGCTVVGAALLRMAAEPWRAPPPLGATVMPIALAAAGCALIGGCTWLALQQRQRAPGRSRWSWHRTC